LNANRRQRIGTDAVAWRCGCVTVLADVLRHQSRLCWARY
jgi:hypothetical protein